MIFEPLTGLPAVSCAQNQPKHHTHLAWCEKLRASFVKFHQHRKTGTPAEYWRVQRSYRHAQSWPSVAV